MKEHYEVVLEELKRKKAEAEAGIQAIENLLLQSSPRAVKPPAARRSNTPTDTEEQSVPQRIMAFLERSPGRAFSIEDIAEGIGRASMRTLMGTLGRLYKQEKIARAGRGRYGAKSNRSARHLIRREDIPRAPQRLPRALTPQQDQSIQQELLRRNDLPSNVLLLMRHKLSAPPPARSHLR